MYTTYNRKYQTITKHDSEINSLQLYFVRFIKETYKARMTTFKITLTPTTLEDKNYHTLAATSAFNLKLFYIVNVHSEYFIIQRLHHPNIMHTMRKIY